MRCRATGCGFESRAHRLFFTGKPALGFSPQSVLEPRYHQTVLFDLQIVERGQRIYHHNQAAPSGSLSWKLKSDALAVGVGRESHLTSPASARRIDANHEPLLFGHPVDQ
jgi:hypothetical protein